MKTHFSNGVMVTGWGYDGGVGSGSSRIVYQSRRDDMVRECVRL